MQFSCGLGQQRRKQTSQSKPQWEQWVLILGKLLKDAGQHFFKGWILSTDAASDAKRSVRLVASDGSSSGGSDSEEDNKTTSGPPNTISSCVPGNKPDHLKRLVDYYPNFESFCRAVWAAEAHKTAASGWSSYIWHTNTRLSLMTDWTVFFRHGLQMQQRFLYSEPHGAPNYFLLHYPLTLCTEFHLGWCHTNPVCRQFGVCVTSLFDRKEKPKEGRGSTHAKFELRLNLSVRFCVLCAARRVWSRWRSSCCLILPKCQSSRSHLLKIHPQPQRPTTSKKLRQTPVWLTIAGLIVSFRSYSVFIM